MDNARVIRVRQADLQNSLRVGSALDVSKNTSWQLQTDLANNSLMHLHCTVPLQYILEGQLEELQGSHSQEA